MAGNIQTISRQYPVNIQAIKRPRASEAKIWIKIEVFEPLTRVLENVVLENTADD